MHVPFDASIRPPRGGRAAEAHQRRASPAPATTSEPRRTMSRLHVRLLGTRHVEWGGRELPLPQRSDTLRLLACLLVQPRPQTPRVELARGLWPELEPGPGRTRLRHSLHALRRWLPPAPAERPWLEVRREHLGWNPEADCWSDVQALLTAARSSRRRRQSRLAELRDALELVSGPLLPGLEDPWTLGARAELARCQQRVLAELGAGLEAAGDLATAAEHDRALLALDPTQEPAHRRLMRLHAARGDRAALLAQAEACRLALDRHLDARPEPRTEQLLTELLAELEAAAGAASVPVAGPRGARLQESAPPYGSRVDHLGRGAALHEALGETRLLTLWGPGGIGKSRLARQLRREDAASPALWVGLDGVQDSAGLLLRLARVLEAETAPTPAAIAAAIGRRRCTLLLDDCEQLITPLAELSERLLSRCPRLQLVLTSRERIRGRGELALALPRLSREATSEAPAGEVGALLGRALALSEPWDAELIAALRALGRDLDGLPRALLQAARAMRAHAPALLARELREDPTRLDALARLESERFASLSESFEQDLRGLPEGPRRLLLRLATAEETLGLPDLLLPAPSRGPAALPASPARRVEQLAELRARSLLEVETGRDGSTRYRLGHCTRHLARRHLGQGAG